MKNRLDFLDGIRGWAAIMVLLSHSAQAMLSAVTPLYKNPAFSFISDGALAVYVFFILSGFVLSVSYLSTKRKSVLAGQATRRYIRLTLPIFLSSLLAYIFLKLGLTYNTEAAPMLQSEKWLGSFYNIEPTITSLLKFSFYKVYFAFDRTTYNAALWTMGNELFGSMLVFALLSIWGEYRFRFFVYVIIGYALIKLHSPILAFILGLGLCEFYLSSHYERLKQSKAIKIISVLLVVAVVIFSTFGRQKFYGNHNNLSFAALILVLAIILFDVFKNFFETRLSKFLGKISFPLYLNHILIISSLSSFTYVSLMNTGLPPTVISNLTLTTTILASLFVAIVFTPVEEFSIKVAKKFSDKFLTAKDS